jgi:thiamine biosynthesis protein ThiS
MDEIILNGKRRSINSGGTIADLLNELELDPRWVLAELNGEPLARDSLGSITLAPGDRLELVRPVAGG